MEEGAGFDRYARCYDEIHARNLAPGGEPPAYYAAYKQGIVERILGRGFSLPILDYGCGVGALTSLLSRSFRTVHGYDPSAESLRVARERARDARFFERPQALPRGEYGAVILANVLHHVAPADRPAFLGEVTALLRSGGALIAFEHNRLNPVTRTIVAACPFDEGARLLHSGELIRLLRGAGLRSIRRDYIVFFPRPLRLLRPLEPMLRWLPLGAQICVRGIRQ